MKNQKLIGDSNAEVRHIVRIGVARLYYIVRTDGVARLRHIVGTKAKQIC